tara:strand:- start:134 stop:376 length:243 start_codon:yes stop_codon:yes gene_type:complete
LPACARREINKLRSRRTSFIISRWKQFSNLFNHEDDGGCGDHINVIVVPCTRTNITVLSDAESNRLHSNQGRKEEVVVVY